MVKLNFLVYFLVFVIILCITGMTGGEKYGDPSTSCPAWIPSGCCANGCCVKNQVELKGVKFDCNCMGCCGSCDGS